MTDYSYNTVIDDGHIGERGKYIQTLMSDQGILRIYWTDNSGVSNINVKDQIYCSIVSNSNLKQVIHDSAGNRGVMSNDGMNPASYGPRFARYLHYDSNATGSASRSSIDGTNYPVCTNNQKFQMHLTHFVDVQAELYYMIRTVMETLEVTIAGGTAKLEDGVSMM